MPRNNFLVTFLLLSASIQAIEIHEKEIDQPGPPWLTGPLLAPSANVVPMGSVNFEPYLYLTGYTGAYDSNWKSEGTPLFWSYSFEFPIQFGIAPYIDFEYSPIVYYDQCEGQNSWAFGDTPIKIDIQVYSESKYIPAIKIGIEETFPTGKYKNLNPKKKQTDAGGTGAYITTVGMTFGKLIPIRGAHYLSARLAMGYDIPTSVYVKGFNTYGGNSGTKGRFYPPKSFNADLGLEYSLTKQWSLALDILYIYSGKSRFKGIVSSTPPLETLSKGGSSGSPIFSTLTAGADTLSGGASVQLSLAPAIEYNWSQYWGVIAGAWFTVAGKNISAFSSGVIAVNYYK